MDRSTFAASTIDIETKKMTKEGVYEPLETFLDEFYKEKEKREIEDYQLDKEVCFECWQAEYLLSFVDQVTIPRDVEQTRRQDLPT